MKTYFITAKGYEGQMSLSYDSEGVLVQIQFSDDCNWNFEQRKSILGRVSASETLVAESFEQAKGQDGKCPFSVTSETYVPSFEQFWADYPADSSYKGSKQDALKSWGKLTDPKRIIAHVGLKEYKRDLKATGQYPKHVSTYLNQFR